LTRFFTDELDLVGLKKQPLGWWRERGIVLYPTRAKLAFTVFSIPGMSSENERAFSKAKKMVTDERYQLKEDIIERTQCVKSWLYEGLVDGSTAWQILNELQRQEREIQEQKLQHYHEDTDDGLE
jgi:hypothetical protein